MLNNGMCKFIVLAAILAVVSSPALSAPTNGTFSDGLTGWTTSNNGVQVVTPGISAGNPAAELFDPQPGSADSVSTLSQTFLIDPTATTLSFWVQTPVAAGGETDHFFVSLYDSVNAPLFNSYNDPSYGIDYLFHWDSDMTWQAGESVFPEEGGPVIDETYPDTSIILYHFQIPVSSLAGTNAMLQFTLRNHVEYEFGTVLDPQINTAIQVDDVELYLSSPAVVPAPAAIGLVVSGIMTVLAMRKRIF